jgi:hypothetical protein
LAAPLKGHVVMVRFVVKVLLAQFYSSPSRAVALIDRGRRYAR